MEPKIQTSLDCSGNGCCPDAVINSDGSVILREGVFTLRLEKTSAEKLARLLIEHGYVKE